MEETELKPIEEKVKEQANRYIQYILFELNRFQRHGEIENPNILMSRDVFNVLQARSGRDLYVNYEFQTIFGCKVDVVPGTQKLYVGCNLLEQEVNR